jgi:hypothetical protein
MSVHGSGGLLIDGEQVEEEFNVAYTVVAEFVQEILDSLFPFHASELGDQDAAHDNCKGIVEIVLV